MCVFAAVFSRRSSVVSLSRWRLTSLLNQIDLRCSPPLALRSLFKKDVGASSVTSGTTAATNTDNNVALVSSRLDCQVVGGGEGG